MIRLASTKAMSLELVPPRFLHIFRLGFGFFRFPLCVCCRRRPRTAALHVDYARAPDTSPTSAAFASKIALQNSVQKQLAFSVEATRHLRKCDLSALTHALRHRDTLAPAPQRKHTKKAEKLFRTEILLLSSMSLCAEKF